MPQFAQYVACAVRKRSNVFLLVCLVLVIYGSWNYISRLRVDGKSVSDQPIIDYLAKYLKVTVTAGDTFPTARSVLITLTNVGYSHISYGQWRIYFYSLAPQRTNETAGFQVRWVNGGLNYLSPIKGKFKGLAPTESVELFFREWKCSSKTDQFPNWYVASTVYGLSSPRIMESTRGESLSFVNQFTNAFQWKRNEFDAYHPYTPTERYNTNNATYGTSTSTSEDLIQVIPKPFSVKPKSDKNVVFDKTWVVVKQSSADTDHVTPSELLALKFGLKTVTQRTSSKYVEFKTSGNFSDEQYEIQVNSDTESIDIITKNGAGAFYGVQTLISMLESSFVIPEVVIKDHPRFKYRGYMIDVSRNFHNKTTIMKLIDTMSMYKLNKLHMHLTDDDGWRIEIPSLPELTMYGSRRCNYFDEELCLSPNLGSGPYPDSSGSGYYTVQDFREILTYAKERYVQVIPEIDVPGHAFAAIKATELRDKNSHLFKNSGNGPSYLLSDDVSGIKSVQGWVGDSLNPCMNSTYRFFETVLTDLKDIYKGVQTLDVVHVGGDEVPKGIWEHSRTCKSMFHGSSLVHNTIKKMFLLTIADIAHKHGMKISVWEDGIYSSKEGPYGAKEFKQSEVYVNTWNNIWEQGTGGRAIEFADQGHKVILSMATHLYFDHPYEPDPEERGLYWATRYTDTYKVFGFIPMNIFANAEFDLSGKRIDLNELCKGPCPHTKAPENYAGMEACIWSETVRNESQLYDMTFPRLLAFAERAWHMAKWEEIVSVPEREKSKKEDFQRFVKVVGKKELPRLEEAGITYRITPPGVIFSEKDRIAKVNTFYQGHKVMVALGNNSRWKYSQNEFKVPVGVSDIYARAISPVLKRGSRTVYLQINSGAQSISCSIHVYITFVLIIVQIIVN
ncbi:beta-hexosaminidase-like [Ruditapes philippinarum]|uniref:beta-hexosaminidase-like n=1 Tax=Ruditapes philippinarum TaxID=129788 RepID=UPI00295B033A|nr:beta-hexosaminidase-like [Ruditapes philippinarum]